MGSDKRAQQGLLKSVGEAQAFHLLFHGPMSTDWADGGGRKSFFCPTHRLVNPLLQLQPQSSLLKEDTFVAATGG